MFEKREALFLYTISPTHLGAGTATGIIDNPIQRERHTRHPSFAGSGVKGALRHGFVALGGNEALVDSLFGPSSNSNDLYAGAVSFGDAQLVCMPIRCPRSSFVHATCPQALARAARLLALCGVTVDWPMLTVEDGNALVLNTALLFVDEQQGERNGVLHLEAFEYRASVSTDLAKVADELAKLALPDNSGNRYFQDKLRTDIVVLSDADFAYYAEHAMAVEPHVRINPQTGAAADGGLFYTENLPPESLLIAPILTTATRSVPKARQDAARRDDKSRSEHGKGKTSEELDADEVLEKIRQLLHGRLLQIGGNATTGRGLMLARMTGG